MSVDELLAELSTLGWLVNNCYQPDSGLWRVSLRKPSGDSGDYCSDWSEGPTLYDAIGDAMSKLGSAEYFDTPITTATIDSSPIPKAKSLLETLGLTKPQPKLRRI